MHWVLGTDENTSFFTLYFLAILSRQKLFECGGVIIEKDGTDCCDDGDNGNDDNINGWLAGSAPQSKKVSIYISDHMQSTYFCLGTFLKKVADDQSSSITMITKGSINCIKHVYINHLALKWIDQIFDV